MRALILLALSAGAARVVTAQADPNDLSARVEIVRTEHGVPHIRAQDLKAFGYGLAWVQLEDYGNGLALGMLRTRGDMGRVFGRDSMESDFTARVDRDRARASYHKLDREVREVYEGFAAGINRWVALHRSEFVANFPADFSGYDIAAQDVGGPSLGLARRFASRLGGPAARQPSPGDEGDAGPDPSVGSNAWAIAPSRTKSKRAILLRNPHLNWDAGYYEAHATVPGVLDFYGDFRIGGPFVVIGGFNKDLGFATTNNNSVQDAIYALDVAPGLTDQVLLDGTAVPLVRETVTVEYKNGDGFSSETREAWRSPIGPVIARTGGKVYVLRTASDGEFRGGEQFLRMMRATSLAEWKAAMRVNARATSNFTYADRAGTIFYVWNATLPAYPHPYLIKDSMPAPVPVHATAEAWTRLVPWDSLPQLLNPKSGFIHQENDPPHFTSVLQPMDSARLPATVPGPALSLRSQLAIDLLSHGPKKMTLDDVIRLKHSYRMLLADRVKPDLLAAIRASGDSALAEAARVLGAWDNTAAPDSRGGVLFENWWRRYRPAGTPNERTFAVVWSKDAPTTTPRGLADTARALSALRQALPVVRQRYGALDVAWGDVHRVREGGKDVPVGGCPGDLGCFRVLSYQNQPDWKRVASVGDGWVLAVEFGDTPTAYSVLAYGESNQPGSPWNGDQGEMFAKGQLKKVRFTQADIDAGAVKRYRPGQAP